MKKTLLLSTFSFFVFIGFSQVPCATVISGNNGGGNCATSECFEVSGKPTGTITIRFDYAITLSEVPEINKIRCDGPTCRDQVLLNQICFKFSSLSADGLTAEYCYYLGGANTNNLFGGGNSYEVELLYPGANIPGCGDQIILPVKLKSFTASRSNANVELKWTTSTEQNNQGFDVLRLSGAGGWQRVGFVGSKATDGNSTGELNYHFSDANPSAVITQYRLQQIDLDAKIKYSEIRAVQGIGQMGRTIVAPNPSSNGQVNVIFKNAGERRNLQLTDMVGRLVKQWNGYADNSLQLTGLQNGIYQLRIVDAASGAQSIEKIVVSGK